MRDSMIIQNRIRKNVMVDNILSHMKNSKRERSENNMIADSILSLNNLNLE